MSGRSWQNSSSALVDCLNVLNIAYRACSLCAVLLVFVPLRPVYIAATKLNRTEINYTVSQKTSHLYNCYNFYIHGLIASIFGTDVAKKVDNQNMLYFPTSPS